MKGRKKINNVSPAVQPKRKYQRVKFSPGKWTVMNFKTLIAESRQFQRHANAKTNLIALKRTLEDITYQEIDLAFRKPIARQKLSSRSDCSHPAQ